MEPELLRTPQLQDPLEQAIYMDMKLLPPPLLMMAINMVGMLGEVVAINLERMPYKGLWHPEKQ